MSHPPSLEDLIQAAQYLEDSESESDGRGRDLACSCEGVKWVLGVALYAVLGCSTRVWVSYKGAGVV